MHPSVEWGVEIPQTSPSRHVDRIDVSLSFLPDKIVISDGKMEWAGSHFVVNGTILKGEKKKPERPVKSKEQKDVPVHVQETVLPVYITERQFQAMENRLMMLSFSNGATIDIDFSIDKTAYADSWANFSAEAEEFDFRGVEFSRAELSASYAYPVIQVERACLFRDKQSLQLNGEYNLESSEAQASLYNSITSNQLLLLLPDAIHELLVKAELRVDYLPRLEIELGPASIKELFNHMTGVFSVRSTAYKGLEVESLRGEVKREKRRLELNRIQGSVLGQEHRAAETGSSMQGGDVEGEVFWDENTREF